MKHIGARTILSVSILVGLSASLAFGFDPQNPDQHDIVRQKKELEVNGTASVDIEDTRPTTTEVVPPTPTPIPPVAAEAPAPVPEAQHLQQVQVDNPNDGANGVDGPAALHMNGVNGADGANGIDGPAARDTASKPPATASSRSQILARPAPVQQRYTNGKPQVTVSQIGRAHV